jgi:hypothetical protein
MYTKNKAFLFFFLSTYFITGLMTSRLLAQSVRNDMVVAMGSTSQTIRVEGLAIQQSIGQSSVTGAYSNSSARLSQGFLRGGYPISKEIRRPFGVIAFPNAFSERINFRFTTDHQEKTLISLYDGKGSLVYQATQVPIANEVQLNLPYLASGIYVVHLRSGNRFVQTRIIKNP